MKWLRSSAALIAPRLKTVCSAPTPHSRRRARMARARRRAAHPLRMAPVPRFARTARSVAAGIASRRRVAPLQPNSQKCCNRARGAVVCAQASMDLHTCEPKSHRTSVYPSHLQDFPIGPRRAIMCHMKYAWLGCLLFLGSLLSAGTQDSEFNVNTRYTVETVVISAEGWTTDLVADHDKNGKLSSGLRKDAAALIGEKLNPTMLEEVGRHIKKEFPARTVEHHVLRGKSPEYVQVVFDVKLRPTRFDVSIPKFLYSSKQAWSGAVEATATVGHNGFTVGGVSDGDELAERYTGMVARYENNKLGTDRVRFRFQFEDYREQWNPATERVTSEDLYRARTNFEPEVTFVLARPLTLSVGASFQRMENQFSA